MTTVVDPAGTPIPFYNVAGTTVSSIAIDMSATGTITDIPAPTGRTLVHATVSGTGLSPSQGTRLPASAQVGDTVELYPFPQSAQYFVHAPTGENLLQSDGTSNSFLVGRGPNKYTKIASDLWVIFGGAIAT